MISITTLMKIASRAFYYTALAVIVSSVRFFDSAQTSNCWAQQTVNVPTTANLQTLVNQYPGGTTFSLAPGIHYLQSVVPQNGDVFVGQTGAILSGAALLTTFTQNGAYWTVQVNVKLASSYPGQCAATSPMCMYPEDLFFNDAIKTRQPSLTAVGPGSWYLDYSTGTVYVGDDPTGYTVEMSELPHAFTGGASSVVISNLTIEKYACVAQSGAVDGTAGTYWAIEGNQIQYNHGRGITTGNGMYVYNNNLFTNGNLGIGGGGTNVYVQSNQISFNNYAGYSIYWEAGGAKWAGIQNLTVEYNYSHDNSGPGLWNDIDSQYVNYNGNATTNNIEAGILSEISFNVTISNNYIWNDGSNPTASTLWYGAGIMVSNSSYVSVYLNTVSNCMNGIVGIIANRGDSPSGQPYLLQNLYVNSNTINQVSGTAAGIATSGSGMSDAVFTSMNNAFSGNTYNLSTAGGNYFYWMQEPIGLAGFVAYGQN
jgi:hypothetical protein